MAALRPLRRPAKRRGVGTRLSRKPDHLYKAIPNLAGALRNWQITLTVYNWRGSFGPILAGIASVNHLKPDQATTPVGRDYFTAIAVTYLAVPSFIFLLTWIRPGIGIPMTLVVAATYILFLRHCESPIPRPKLGAGTWVFLLATAFAWTLFAGIGGFVLQGDDYEKHNLAYHDLLSQTWPVRYVSETQTNYLCYGLGYYLAPTLVARTLGENWLPAACFLWGFIGVALVFYWLATFSNAPRKTLVIVLAFAGTEALWHLFLHALHTPSFSARGESINLSLDHLGIRSAFSDNFSALQYRPQHVLPAWLGVALFYDMFRVRRDPRAAGFVGALLCLWSPLTCLGLLLIPLATLTEWCWRQVFSLVNLGGGILLVVLAIFFQGHVPMVEQGPIWKFSTGNDWPALYLCFLALQLGPMVLLCLADRKYGLLDELRPFVWGGLLLLVLLPLYKIGYYGDQRLQAQTPALLIFGLAASRCFLNARFSWKYPLCLLLAASQ